MREFLQRVEQWAFLLCIVTLPIIDLARKMPLPPLIGRNLPRSFLLIGIAALILEWMKYRDVKFPYVKFWLVSSAWLVLAQAVGAVQFPYFAEQAPQLLANAGDTALWRWLRNGIGEETLPAFLSFSQLAWPMLKRELLYAVGAFFLIYHLYGKDWEKGFRDACVAVRILAGLCCAYSAFEVVWLWTGNEVCEETLKTINMCLYDTQHMYGWWPPLLWENGVRSLFREASFFGIGAVFMIPFLMYSTIYEKRKLDALLLSFLTMLVFLSNSRTGVIVLLTEAFILLGLSAVFKCPKWKVCMKCVLGFTGVAFIVMIMGNAYFLHRSGEVAPEKIVATISEEVSEYIKDNIASAVGLGKRSNTARYGNTAARIRVAMEHPVFGTGYEYENWYIRDAFPEWAKDNEEVKGWTRHLLKDGALKTSYPVTNYYAGTLSRCGIPGLLLFLLSPLYVFIQLGRRRKLLSDFRVVCLATIVLGQLICMLSAVWFFSYPISLSLLACAVLSGSKGTGEEQGKRS